MFSFDWQQGLTALLVAVAGIYLLRRVLRMLAGTSKGCGSCGSCARKEEGNGGMVSVEQLRGTATRTFNDKLKMTNDK